MTWIALGMCLARHEKLAASEAAFELAVLTRPQVAAIPAIAGVLAASMPVLWEGAGTVLRQTGRM